MNVLVATDAQWLADAVVAALRDDHTSFTICSEGREVAPLLKQAVKDGRTYDIAVLDLQIGTMGGMAVAMAMRHDAGAGTAPEIPTLMLLDRVADVHLAKRSAADGWLVKPIDPLRLRRAVRTIAAGGSYTEGLVEPPLFEQVSVEPEDVIAVDDVTTADEVAASAASTA